MSRALVLLPLLACLWREPGFHREAPAPGPAALAGLTAGELRLIPGVGPAMAGRILQAGSVSSGAAKGLGPRTELLLRRYITE